MRKKSRNFLTLFILSIAMFSCGEDKKEQGVVSPVDTEIQGDLSKYLKIIDGEYEIVDEWGGHISIKLEATNPISPESFDGKNISLVGTLLDEKTMPVSGTGDFKMERNSEEKVRNILIAGSGSTVVELSCLLGDYNEDDHAESVKFIEITGNLVDKKVYGNSDNETENSESGSSSYDKMLDDYEEYVDEYVTMMSKMEDETYSMDDINPVVEKTDKLLKSLEAAQGDGNLSSDQVNRMLDIQSKMLEAM